MNPETKFDLNLAILVESKPILYDKSVAGYKDEEAKKNAWEAIAVLIREQGYEVDADIVASRWRRIRERYSRERKAEITSGSEAVKEWPVFQHLAFLEKHVKRRSTKSYFVRQKPSMSIDPQGPLWGLKLTQPEPVDEDLNDLEEAGSSSNNESPPSASTSSRFAAQPPKRQRVHEAPARGPSFSGKNSINSDIAAAMQDIREVSASIQSAFLGQLQKNYVSADEKSLRGLINILMPMWKTLSVSKQGELAANVIQMFVKECCEGSQ